MEEDTIRRVFGEQRDQCCSGGGEANDEDRVASTTPLWGRCGCLVKERKGMIGGTHMSVSKELESSGCILGPYENMKVCMWVHVVYG